ncbi:unnamed protein product [Diatraea saccharalis]|uniref:Uncharacterized protein n=1 Tax=Diatraea saccharalis TaxID=40085 RepID=A0A9N9R409_9NEOP|nr:unnamed protein product [Diatraea saccharalis]
MSWSLEIPINQVSLYLRVVIASPRWPRKVEDSERPGCQTTSTTNDNVKKVKEMVMNDRRITIREVDNDVGISVGSCHERAAAKFVPKLLNFEQEQRRIRVITGDETWVRI